MKILIVFNTLPHTYSSQDIFLKLYWGPEIPVLPLVFIN
jgi:hypothetical protein